MYIFYCFHPDKKILLSNRPAEKVRGKFGNKFEIVNSTKDLDAVEIIKKRVMRSYPTFILEEWIQKPRFHSEETKRKISESLKGRSKKPETCAKISKRLKGRSNFQGKRHTLSTKQTMREKKIGNQHVKDTFWAHDPRSDKEARVRSRHQLPSGFILGRDYYSTEPGLYYLRSTNFPRGRRPSRGL